MPGYNFLNQVYSSIGLKFESITGDGNCFYRSVSDQMYGTEVRHMYLRNLTVKKLISKSSEYSGNLMTKNEWKRFLADIRRFGNWADSLEILALAEVLNVYIFVHDDRGNIYSYPDVDVKQNKRTIHVWYEGGCHYCSIRSIDSEAASSFQATNVPKFSGWEKLSSQDKNKFNLFNQLGDIKDFDQISMILKKSRGSMVDALSKFYKTNGSKKTSAPVRKSRPLKRSIDSEVKETKTQAPREIVPVDRRKIRQVRSQMGRRNSKSPPKRPSPAAEKVLVPLDGYKNVFKVPLSKAEYKRLVAPLFKSVPLANYFTPSPKKIRTA